MIQSHTKIIMFTYQLYNRNTSTTVSWPIQPCQYAAVNVNLAPPPHGQGCYNILNIYAFTTFLTYP